MNETTPLAPSLLAFFPSLGSEGFLNEYWRKKPLHLPGTEARLENLVKEMGTLDLAAILSRCKIDIWKEHDPQAPQLAGSMTEALDAYYNQSGTLYAHLRKDAKLYKWLQELCFELGEFAGAATLSFFAVRENGGSTAHYDTSDVITVQLQGNKKWRVAPNDFVDRPDRNWSLGAPLPPFCKEKVAIDSLPDETVEYELKPGDILYMPRTWFHHVTAAEQPSLSCAFTFKPVLWGEGFLAVLKQRLMNHPELREPMLGAFGSRWDFATTAQKSSSMLKTVQTDIAGLTTGDLIAIAQTLIDE